MTDENEATACSSISEVKPFGSDAPLRCLLVSPHPFYRHYAAHPGDPDRFWTWDDKHPEHPCPSVDCPGDARYAPPGRGHYAGCPYLHFPPVERLPADAPWPREECGSRGPRIGEDGTLCRRSKGHGGPHRTAPSDGFGNVEWPNWDRSNPPGVSE